MAKGITAKRVGHAALHVLRWMAVMLRNGRLPAGVGAFALGVAFLWLATDPAFARAGLAAEARALMKDHAYVSEAREVAAPMEQLRGPW